MICHGRLELAKEAAHQWLERCVDRRGRRASVLAQARVQCVRERDRDLRHLLRKEFADPELVRRIQDRPEKADRDRLHLERAQSFGHLADCVFVELCVHLAVGEDPFGDLEGERRGMYGAGYSCV